jgi:hypothetical protein
VPPARARLRRFEWTVGAKRVNGRYNPKYRAVRAVGVFPANASLCVTVPGEALRVSRGRGGCCVYQLAV